MQKCPNCKSENAEANSYCGSCGLALKPESDRLRRDIAEAVRAELARSLKDRDVVEMEVSEAVTTKVIGWAKTFGIVTAVPLGIATIVLGMLGIRTYSDFNTINAKAEETKITVRKAQDEITKQVEEAKGNADKIKKNSEYVEAERMARSLTDQYYYSEAAAILQDLYINNQKDELLFSRLVEADVAANDVSAAVGLIKSKFDALDAKQIGSFVQAGHVLMRYQIERQVPNESKITADTGLSLDEAERKFKAGEALSKAVDDQLNWKNLMGELAICYALEGKDSWDKAISYGHRWAKQSSDLGPPVPWQPPKNERWATQLDKGFVVKLQNEVFK